MKVTERFSDRVQAYVRFRPDYPSALLEALWARAPGAAVDLGCGTGILSAQLVAAGFRVTGVEPNGPMGDWAAEAVGGAFQLVRSTAEATTLPDGCCQLVTAAQAFHWFRPLEVRAECIRLLVPGGVVALIWNDRDPRQSALLRGYEALLQAHGTDYADVAAKYVQPEVLAAFFGPAGHEERFFPHAQRFDREGLRGRLESSSYVPRPGTPGHAPMLEALDRLFDAHEHAGFVDFPYRTRLVWGTLS